MAPAHDHRVVYPTRADVRLFEPDVASVSTWPDPIIDQRLLEAISDVETICERRFIPTRVTEAHFADNEANVFVREGHAAHREGAIEEVVTCAYGSTTVPVAGLSIGRAGRLLGAEWPQDQLIRVTYGTGLATCPPKIFELITRLTRVYTLRSKSAVPDRAERFSIGDDGRTFVLAMPSVRALGMPDVDATIARWSLHQGVSS